MTLKITCRVMIPQVIYRAATQQVIRITTSQQIMLYLWLDTSHAELLSKQAHAERIKISRKSELIAHTSVTTTSLLKSVSLEHVGIRVHETVAVIMFVVRT